MNILSRIFMFLLMALPVQAADLTVIADRTGDDLEIYFRFPSSQMVELFGSIPDGVLDDDGFVDFHSLQQDTITPGALLATETTATNGRTGLELEAISFMTHPKDTVLPFSTPWDALTTTTFCSTDPDGEKQKLDVMKTYVGYFADGVRGNQPVRLDLPYMGNDPIIVTVLEFSEKAKIAEYESALQSNGVLTLFEDARPSQGLFSWLTGK